MEPTARTWRWRAAAHRETLAGQENDAVENTDLRIGTRFTKVQGQYLAYIATYTKLHGRPPAEADIQGYFKVTPPSVHNMIVALDRLGLIERVPRQAR